MLCDIFCYCCGGNMSLTVGVVSAAAILRNSLSDHLIGNH
ncbi:MAG: hypothetical protein Hyperionvirus5_67 [Hyperionvirus sp.]|uniref:Uncharacterized protein n=1 Tax=Hyperionvirus sp. TaxID=2487770 RepID=A0A3G5AAN0_9VIRU|nr:MAG: hypothetical protein Hyperionvirus5_67 [Hyperionvirus sp.]